MTSFVNREEFGVILHASLDPDNNALEITSIEHRIPAGFCIDG